MKFTLVDKILMNLKNLVINKFSGRPYAFIMSVLSGFKIAYGYEDDRYFAAEGTSKHFHLKHRGGRYLNGLMNCGEKLAKSYGIENIEIQKSDVIVDVGANNGDLLLYLAKFPRIQYIGFEPSIVEFNLLKLNCGLKTIYNFAVTDSNGITNFFTSTFGADSSIYQPKNVEQKTVVHSIRLDDFLSQFSKIKILKIDAEGAEFEVIKGSEKILEQIEYIAVDLGFEKGIKQETTAPEVINFLTTNNFSILKFTKRNSFLFHNRNYLTSS